jgi:hypothetical protein
MDRPIEIRKVETAVADFRRKLKEKWLWLERVETETKVLGGNLFKSKGGGYREKDS